MNLRQLEVFIAVAESGSFSRAAEITFLTQSTVSQHISSLENEFDLKLLDRTGKGALLTEAGKLLLTHARRVVEEAREVPLALNRFRGLAEVELKIGGSNIPACYIIPDCIFSFRERHPGVTITLLQGDSRETVERLKRQEVEFALVGSLFAEKDLDFIPLTLDKISLAVPAGHPWSGVESIQPEDLVGEPLIFREQGSGTGRTFRDELVKAGLDPAKLKVSICLGSNEAIKQAIQSGAGISFLSELSVKKECERGEMSIVRVRGLEISRHFYLVTRRGRSLAPAAEAFIDLLVQQFRPQQEGGATGA
jgi:LysR family transcriptional regulator, low CO2-responsive transcriptional regulator